MSACGKEVKQDEPVIQVAEQRSEPESIIEEQGEPESIAVKAENPNGSPDEDSGLEENAGELPANTSATSKPAATATPKPAATQKPAATDTPAAPTPEPHTSCTWDGGTVTTAAGCNSEGVKTFTCTVCGNTKTESIAAAGHSYTTDSKAATCTEPGYTKTYCTVCGDVQSETVQPATGHTLVEKWIDDQWYHAATCTSDGTGHFNSCINCKYAENLPWPALGHEPDAGTVYRAGTCTRPAKISHKCTRCGCDLEDTVGAIDPNNHDWAIDPEDGVEYCAECGLVK